MRIHYNITGDKLPDRIGGHGTCIKPGGHLAAWRESASISNPRKTLHSREKHMLEWRVLEPFREEREVW